MKKKNLKYKEEVSVEFSKREMDLLLNETFVGDTYFLSADKSGSNFKVNLDLGKLEDIIGHLAAAANHAANEKLEKELDALYDKIEIITDRYEK
jgi:flagellin-specific chaperone FliS